MTSATVLAQVSLFAELSEGELESLAAGLERRRYARGQTIFMRGDPGTSLYIIESGIVKIIVTSPEGKALIVNVLGAGEFFGELALLDGDTYTAGIERIKQKIAGNEKAVFITDIQVKMQLGYKPAA